MSSLETCDFFLGEKALKSLVTLPQEEVQSVERADERIRISPWQCQKGPPSLQPAPLSFGARKPLGGGTARFSFSQDAFCSWIGAVGVGQAGGGWGCRG